MTATYEQIMADLQRGSYANIYFLMGDEPYFIDKITGYIAENALKDNEKSFNQIVLYGKDTNIREVINTAKRFPMMAERMVVIVKEAQNLRNIEDLKFYVEKPQKSTILVFNYKYKTLDKRKSLYKLLQKATNAVLFESKKLYENQIPRWIRSYLKQAGYKIDPVAEQLLTEHLGTDLGKIANELEKLTILLPKGTVITPQIIEQNVGISKDFNTFELQRALGEKNFNRVFLITDYFAHNPKAAPFVVVISSLYFYFAKVMKVHASPRKDKHSLAKLLGVNPFFVPEYQTAARNYPPAKIVRIFKLLREYDLKNKGVNNASTPPGELLKELMFKILYA